MVIEKNWKYYLGISLFVYSFIPICTAELVFFLPLSKTVAASVVMVYLGSGELSFLGAIALLGKPFIEAIKTKMKAFFLPSQISGPPRPIGRTRHYVGVSLFFISFLPYPGTEVALLLSDPARINLTALLAVMFLGDAVFIASLFILGSEFWERLKRLFAWPGQTGLSAVPSPQPDRKS
jgi:hypothetical protein